jgi:hypothetical protein
MPPVIEVKRKCLVCDKEFTQVDYAFHIQEEILSQLMVMNETLADIKEITDMTYEYMNTDDNYDPVNSKIALDDDLDLGDDAPPLTPEAQQKLQDETDLLLTKVTYDYHKELEKENATSDDFTKCESTDISSINGSSDVTIHRGNDTKSDPAVIPSTPIIGEVKTDGEESITNGELTQVASTVFDHTKSKELENVTLDDILKRIMDR